MNNCVKQDKYSRKYAEDESKLYEIDIDKYLDDHLVQHRVPLIRTPIFNY